MNVSNDPTIHPSMHTKLTYTYVHIYTCTYVYIYILKYTLHVVEIVDADFLYDKCYEAFWVDGSLFYIKFTTHRDELPLFEASDNSANTVNSSTGILLATSMLSSVIAFLF